MSAKLAYQKAPVNLPDLPVELWGLILRYATRVPDTLGDLSMERYSGVSLRGKRYQEALVTKRLVVRVCRTWNELATPYLYEHIQVHRFGKLDAILKSLELPLIRIKNDIAPILGCLTKRLDIARSSESRLEWASVLQLFRLTPNLVTVRADYQGFKGVVSDYPCMRSNTGMGVILPSLEAIDLAEAFQVPVAPLASQYIALMECHPNLRRLDLMAARLIHDLPISQLPPSSHTWPSIREIDFFPDELATWKSIFPPGAFPNLERAVTLCHSPTVATLADCLQTHGQHLKSVLLAYDDSMTARARGRSLQMWHDAEAMLGILRMSCPLLEELSFSAHGVRIPSAPRNCRDPAVIETVTTLGIEVGARHFQFSKKVCTNLLGSALSWTRRGNLPNLRTIRFISETNALHLQKCHAKKLNGFIEECGSAGIVVQDSFHIPLTPQGEDSSTGSDSSSRGHAAVHACT